MCGIAYPEIAVDLATNLLTHKIAQRVFSGHLTPVSQRSARFLLSVRSQRWVALLHADLLDLHVTPYHQLCPHVGTPRNTTSGISVAENVVPGSKMDYALDLRAVRLGVWPPAPRMHVVKAADPLSHVISFLAIRYVRGQN